ncbi:MAG: xanthine dehydrogenase small subunit [Candidatus Poriferisodalaceae bacterium]|jgi:xanthine dehydrogenase small subunit
MQFHVDGEQVEVEDTGDTLLAVLRALGRASVKDGCSPQGQCGCCTVLVDGAPRVSCVTPARRVAGRSIETIDGLEVSERDRWVDAFVATGASQCGFCTPGIVCRLVGQERKGADLTDRDIVDRALSAHLCRCTGWQTIVEAAEIAVNNPGIRASRDMAAAAAQATLEGRNVQSAGPDVVVGRGGFADDGAPADAPVAVRNADGDWIVGATLAEARAASGKVQGRRTTLDASPPIGVPPGDWDVTLATSWVEPGYLEPDATWSDGAGNLADPLANGGAFGGKQQTRGLLGPIADQLAFDHGRPVRVLWSREDVVRFGPKRPPIAAGMKSDGTGVVRVARTEGAAQAITAVLPDVTVEEVDVPGPPTSMALRAAGWAEAVMLAAAIKGENRLVRSPEGGAALAGYEATVGGRGRITVEVDPGTVLDEIVLRSYVIGAAHMAYSWVTSEQLTVDAVGEVHDLTIRSFGIVRSAETPKIDVVISPSGGEPVACSDAVFAAVAAAVWLQRGGSVLPTG